MYPKCRLQLTHVIYIYIYRERERERDALIMTSIIIFVITFMIWRIMAQGALAPRRGARASFIAHPLKLFGKTFGEPFGVPFRNAFGTRGDMAAPHAHHTHTREHSRRNWSQNVLLALCRWRRHISACRPHPLVSPEDDVGSASHAGDREHFGDRGDREQVDDRENFGGYHHPCIIAKVSSPMYDHTYLSPPPDLPFWSFEEKWKFRKNILFCFDVLHN